MKERRGELSGSPLALDPPDQLTSSSTTSSHTHSNARPPPSPTTHLPPRHVRLASSSGLRPGHRQRPRLAPAPGDRAPRPRCLPQGRRRPARRRAPQLGRRLPRSVPPLLLPLPSTRSHGKADPASRRNRRPELPRRLHEHRVGADRGVGQRPQDQRLRRRVRARQQRCAPFPLLPLSARALRIQG